MMGQWLARNAYQSAHRSKCTKQQQCVGPLAGMQRFGGCLLRGGRAVKPFTLVQLYRRRGHVYIRTRGMNEPHPRQLSHCAGQSFVMLLQNECVAIHVRYRRSIIGCVALPLIRKSRISLTFARDFAADGILQVRIRKAR